jgi:hypothetical protein
MRKKKEDIMKNLHNVTPTVIKSIIENNDFNKFKPWNESVLFESSRLTAKICESNENSPM